MTPPPFDHETLARVAAAVARVGDGKIEPIGEVLLDMARMIADPCASQPATDDPYWRAPLYRSRTLEIVIMCFGPARDWLPHDHGQSEGWVYVRDGRAEHVLFAFEGDGALREQRREHLEAGSLIFMPKGMIHTLGPAAGHRLSTIFAYAPPITGMGVYNPSAGCGCIVSDDCGAWWPTQPEQLVREFHFSPHEPTSVPKKP